MRKVSEAAAMRRRTFLKGALVLAAGGLGAAVRRELRITRITVQTARGRRLTPVAPNAYAKYRGYDVSEPVVRIQTKEGLEGIGRYQTRPEILQRLIGLDPFALFRWKNDVIEDAADEHRELLSSLYGSDVALLDLMGKALKRPIAALLGQPERQSVKVYDSSLYMEDLLTPKECEGVAFLAAAATEPADRVARKARWILNQAEGIRILKIKIGRAKWMASFDEALARDIAVIRAVRRETGRDVTLFVDGNDGYNTRPLAAADFAESVRDDGVYAMEEMFSEKNVEALREVKRRMRAKGIATRLADGENDRNGVPAGICEQVIDAGSGPEPLIDIEQADMNANGYLRLRRIARDRAKHRMTIAPHNFGSKLGFWSQVHLGLVTPNWEFCETDDSQFPALIPEGIEVRNGFAAAEGPGLGVTLEPNALERPSLELGN